MSFFNIKVKTKSGNDIKKKETMTVFFRVRYRKNAFNKKVTATYTYRIMHSGGVADCKKVMEIKNPENIQSLEDLTLKVILNMCFVLAKITEKHNINPDFIMFVSPDLNGRKNKAFLFLKNVFKANKILPSTTEGIQSLDVSDTWDKSTCESYKISFDDLEKLRTFVEINPNTVFMNIDPDMDRAKYAKSIAVCNALELRMCGVSSELEFDY